MFMTRTLNVRVLRLRLFVLAALLGPGCADRSYAPDLVPGGAGTPCLRVEDDDDPQCQAGLTCDGKLKLCVPAGAADGDVGPAPLVPEPDKVAPSTEACPGAVMRTAVEVAYDGLAEGALGAVKTVVAEQGYDATFSDGALKYANALKDTVYMGADGKIVISSPCELDGLGVLRRLQGALIEMAGFIRSAQPDADVDEITSSLCSPVAVYSSSTQFAFASVTPTAGFTEGGTGYLAVPESVSQAAFATCGFNWKADLEISATLNGTPVLEAVSPGLRDGSHFSVWYDLTEKLAGGTYGVAFSGTFGCGAGCDGWVETWFALLVAPGDTDAASWTGESEGFGKVIATTPLKDLELP